MNKIVDKKYTASVDLKGNRGGGNVHSHDGNLDLVISKPKEMGGQGLPGTNPEQLFASGYSACFGGAMAVIAKGRNINDMEISTQCHFGVADDGGFAVAVDMTIKLPHLDKDTARQVVDEAHQICPYSRATRNNIEVNFNIA